MWIVYPDVPGMPANPHANAGMSRDFGTLRVRRKPVGANAIALEITQTTRQAGWGGFGHALEANVTCAADALCTPQSWDVRSVMLDQKHRPVQDTEWRKRGKVDGGAIRYAGKAERRMPAPKAYTSNWSLLDALQRLPGDDAKPTVFDLLEELDLLKPHQRLAFYRVVEMELGGKKTRLHGFSLIGEGILPYEFWLDDQRRVLLAIGGRRAYVFNPAAEVMEVKR
jgi:hypothetical protein